MATTDSNLKEAFAGESQANRKYLAFAKKADAEGRPQIAKLFRAVAAAETVHAHAHLRVMKGVGDTKQNLQAAIGGEAYEFQEMYPKFVQEAEAEGNKAALSSLRNAMTVEKTHHGLYTEALEALLADRRELKSVWYLAQETEWSGRLYSDGAGGAAAAIFSASIVQSAPVRLNASLSFTAEA